MSDFRKLAEAKKAEIRREAEQREAQVDADLKKLEELAAKYGLAVTAPEAAQGSPVQPDWLGALVDNKNRLEALVALNTNNASTSARAKQMAEAYIRSKKRPVLLGELHTWLESQGVKFDGDTPRSTLSAVLGQAPNLYSISRSKGWWLKGVPEPDFDYLE